MSDYGFQDVDFQLAGASGDQTISLVGGPGKTIKAYEILLSGATAQDTITAGGRMSYGQFDGTTKRCVAIISRDNTIAAGATCGYRIDTGRVAAMPVATGVGLEVGLVPVSMGVDQITVNASAASTLRGVVRMYFGTDLVVKVESLASSASIGGTVSSTALGVPPDLVIAAGCGQAFISDGSGTPLMFSYGAAGRLPALTQACAALCAEDSVVVRTSSGILVRDDAILTTLASASGTVTEGTRLELSFDATGFTITTRNAAVSVEGMFMSFSFGGAKCRAAVPLIDVSATGDESTTDTGFRTRGLALLLTNRTSGEINVIGSAAAAGKFSLGWGLPGGISRAVGFLAADNQLTSVTKSVVRSADIMDTVIDATTHDGIASLPSIDALGYTLNVSDAAVATRLVLSISVGDRADPGWWASLRRWRRQLGRM